MNLKQNGLRRRVEIEGRRISSQHRQLDEFYSVVADALARNDRGAVRAGYQRFRDALEAHLTMEEEIHFPALHGLRAELEAELTALVEEHRAFRKTLVRLQELFDAGELAEGQRVFDAFVTELAAHEGREERLIARPRRS